MHLEDVLALLDARLDSLTTVVRMKPAVEVVHAIVITVVKQKRIAHCVTGGIVSQRHVDWVNEATIDCGIGPGGKMCIATYRCESHSGLAAASMRSDICVLRALV